MNNKLLKVVYAPSQISSEEIYSVWQYFMYELVQFPETNFLGSHIKAYEKEMIKREGNLYDFIEKERKKLI